MPVVKANTKKGSNLAVIYLKKGKAVVYPTDTAYGLAVDAANTRALRRLYTIKGRSFKKPVHVVVSSMAMAKKYVKFNKLAERVFRKLLPGPLTLVLGLEIRNQRSGQNSSSPSEIKEGSRGEFQKNEIKALELLSAKTGTLGIRMPKNKTALGLVKKLGRPITATSANLSGGKTAYSVSEALKQFQNKKFQPDLYLDQGRLPTRRKTSTIVDLTSENVRIIRRGWITKIQILKVLKT